MWQDRKHDSCARNPTLRPFGSAFENSACASDGTLHQGLHGSSVESTGGTCPIPNGHLPSSGRNSLVSIITPPPTLPAQYNDRLRTFHGPISYFPFFNTFSMNPLGRTGVGCCSIPDNTFCNFLFRCFERQRGRKQRDTDSLSLTLTDALTGWFLHVPWPEIKPAISVCHGNVLTNWTPWPGLFCNFQEKEGRDLKQRKMWI